MKSILLTAVLLLVPNMVHAQDMGHPVTVITNSGAYYTCGLVNANPNPQSCVNMAQSNGGSLSIYADSVTANGSGNYTATNVRLSDGTQLGSGTLTPTDSTHWNLHASNGTVTLNQTFTQLWHSTGGRYGHYVWWWADLGGTVTYQ